MKPIEFKHQNVVYAKDQPEYQPLPALKIDSPQGEVISCWQMSFKERMKVLFTGVIWVSLVSFNKPLTPSFISVNRKDVYSHEDDNKPMLNITWLHFVNVIFFQWFFVRLARLVNTDTHKTEGYKFIYWIVPTTGWDSDYKYIFRKNNAN